MPGHRARTVHFESMYRDGSDDDSPLSSAPDDLSEVGADFYSDAEPIQEEPKANGSTWFVMGPADVAAAQARQAPFVVGKKLRRS